MSETPTPGSWIKKPERPVAPKRPYVLKPHLTVRPLSDDARLAELRIQLKKGTK